MTKRTSRFIYSTLIEVDAVTGIPTGRTKANQEGDVDYIAPMISQSKCSSQDGVQVTYGVIIKITPELQLIDLTTFVVGNIIKVSWGTGVVNDDIQYQYTNNGQYLVKIVTDDQPVELTLQSFIDEVVSSTSNVIIV